jgi:hypothetical protein
MFAFSSNESAVLERKADIVEGILPTDTSDINYYYELDRCAEWAKKNSLSKVLSLFLVLFA